MTMNVFAVGKALDAEGVAAALVFPLDFALFEITLGDAATLIFGDEDAAATDDLGVHG